MAKTVGAAFNAFMINTVNLAKERTDKARSSRDALIDKINNLDDFFPLLKDKHLHYGSFARRTKIRPIDDIDIMICIDVEGKLERQADAYSAVVTDVSNSAIYYCCDERYSFNGKRIYTLNSNKVKNYFKAQLRTLHDCRKAELHSNKEAITLQYSSYEWNFDIVPSIFVNDDKNGFYIIPDGHGAWKKTDPRKDRDMVTSENTRLGGKVLDLIRLAKYWSRTNMGDLIPSYLLESMVIEYCKQQTQLSDYIDISFIHLLEYFINAALYSVQDMKGIQGDINTLPWEQKLKFRQQATSDYSIARKANDAEINEKDQRKAMGFWRIILGDKFPAYE